MLGDVRGSDLLELGCGGRAMVDRAAAARRAGRRPRPLGAQLAARATASTSVPARARERRAAAVRRRRVRHRVLRSRRDELLRSAHRARRSAPALRAGGLLAFCVAHPLLYLTWDKEKAAQTRRLQLDYDDLGPHGRSARAPSTGRCRPGEWIAVLRAHGFDVEDCVELRPPAELDHDLHGFAPPKWARRWPAEWIWGAPRLVSRAATSGACLEQRTTLVDAVVQAIACRASRARRGSTGARRGRDDQDPHRRTAASSLARTSDCGARLRGRCPAAS